MKKYNLLKKVKSNIFSIKIGFLLINSILEFIFQYYSHFYKSNLLIGSIINYNWETIEPFFQSFKYAHFENCQCIMFIRNMAPEVIKKIKSFGVKVHKIPYKFHKKAIINYRWKLYEKYLEHKLNRYKLVFTADLRDTIFQKDIFKFYTKYEKHNSFLGVAIEDGTLSEKTNKNWLINAYGENLFNIIQNERIICVGTIWGTPDKFYEFSKIMWEKLDSKWSLRLNVIEQAVANFLIYYEKKFNNYIIKSENKKGPVMTIGITDRRNINLDLDDNIINGNGEIAAVIHQYDRKPDIVEKIKKKYCSNHNISNPTINNN